jgi:hypothetical protein
MSNNFVKTNSIPPANVETITPEQAKAWLDVPCLRQRAINMPQVRQLERSILAGEFQPSGDTIKIGVDNSVLNGQHRLLACVRTNTPIQEYVIRNFPLSAMIAVDQGRTRSTANILKCAGISVPPRIGPILRSMATPLRANGTNGYIRLSAPEFVGMLESYADAAEFVLEHQGIQAHTKIASYRAAIARAYYSVDHDDLKNFMQIVAGNGVDTDDPRNTGPILLRNYLHNTCNRGGGGTVREECYKKTERALSAYLNGESLGTLRAATEELFPLPVLDERLEAVIQN